MKTFFVEYKWFCWKQPYHRGSVEGTDWGSWGSHWGGISFGIHRVGALMSLQLSIQLCVSIQLLFYILAENKHTNTQKWAFQLSNPPFAPSPQPHFEKGLWPAAAPPPPAGQPHLSWGASGEKEEQESPSLAATGPSKLQQITTE